MNLTIHLPTLTDLVFLTTMWIWAHPVASVFIGVGIGLWLAACRWAWLKATDDGIRGLSRLILTALPLLTWILSQMVVQ